MKKVRNIIGIGSLMLIFILTLAGTDIGSKPENNLASLRQNPEISITVKDTIPQGKMTYELFFAEFDGRMKNLPVEINITGDKIIVYNNKKNPLTGGEIIITGTLLRHKSGKWVIGQKKTDQNAEEIGGCSGGPTPIDFEMKLIEWC